MAGTLSQVIEIIVSLTDMTKAGVNSAVQNVSKLREGIAESNKVISASRKEMATFVEQPKQLKTSMGQAALGARQFTHGLRGFRMEMLGVMFFGMGIQKFFANFTKGAWEAFGVTERFRQTFEEMVMIAVEPFVDSIHGMLDALEELPDEQKVTIGLAIVGAELLGGILFNIGMMSLGIGSLIQAFGGLAIFQGISAAIIAGWLAIKAAVLSVVGVISGAISTLGAVALAGIALIIIGILNNWEGFMHALGKIWNTIVNVVMGAATSIGGIIDFLIGLVTGDFELMGKGIVNFFKGIGQIVVIGVLGIIDSIVSMFLAIEYGIGKFFVNIGIGIAEFVNMLVGGAKNGGKQFVENLMSGIRVGLRDLGRTIWSFVPEPLRGWMQGGLSGITGWIGGGFTGRSFQHGGIVTSPTIAMIGEAGPEAIVPLTGGGGLAPITINPVYNVTASISGDSDIRRIAEKLNSYLVSDYRRLTYR